MSEYIHGENIANKMRSETGDVNKVYLKEIDKTYRKWLLALDSIKGDSDAAITKKVTLFNEYKNFIDQPKFRKEKGNTNGFTAQSKLHSTVIEEFMYHLLKGIPVLKDKALLFGPTKAYSNLYFAPTDLNTFEEKSGIVINTKDQDFAISKKIIITTKAAGGGEPEKKEVSVPVVSIECKTYLDKTMYEGSVATAEKIKRGNPYSLFLIVTETYEVSSDVDPKYSQIDQIYVLRKSSKRNERLPVQADIVIALYKRVAAHLCADWRNVEKRIESGILI